MSEPICVDCGEPFPVARRKLGYKTCLDCGETRALHESDRRRTCLAPAYNKGPYMYVCSKQLAHDAGKK